MPFFLRKKRIRAAPPFYFSLEVEVEGSHCMKYNFFLYHPPNHRIYVRKSREKKFLEKKPGNKNFGKKVRIL